MERVIELASRSLSVIAICSVMAMATGLIILRHHGDQLLSVQTASMTPAFRPGDALVVAPTPVSQLQPGEVISYHSPKASRVIVSHRLTNINRRTGQLTTAGDALHSPDPPVPDSLLVGRVIAVAPDLGGILDFLRQPLGLVVALYAPALIVVGCEFYRIINHYRHPGYRHLSYR